MGNFKLFLDALGSFIESRAGTIALLFFGLTLFSGVTFFVDRTAPSNERLVLMFSQLVSGFSGALFIAINTASRNSTEVTGKNPEVTINQAEPTQKP